MYDPDTHHRQSIRLKQYDYSQAGAYFVTICAQNRQCLFGGINNGTMMNNAAGEMISTIWHEIPEYYPGIGIDAFQIMPNHIHGIIIVGASPRGCPDPRACPVQGQPSGQAQGTASENGQAQGPAPTVGLSFPDIVHRFKTMTTKKYTDGVKDNGWQAFNRRLWQRNYYEHVMRDDEDLTRTREYISNNPLRWADDPDYMTANTLIVGAPPRGCPDPRACPNENISKGQPQGVAPTIKL